MCSHINKYTCSSIVCSYRFQSIVSQSTTRYSLNSISALLGKLNGRMLKIQELVWLGLVLLNISSLCTSESSTLLVTNVVSKPVSG